LVSNFPPFAIPGVVDGKVLTEPIGTALSAGRFARVPVLNGMNHDEERIFLAIGATVSQGTFVPVTEPVSDASFEERIKAALGVDDARAAAIAQVYPTASFASPTVAFSTLVSDASFACTALQVDEWTSRWVRTFAYEFSDDAAPPRYAPLGVATHTSEIPYLIDLPNAPIQVPLNADQEQLASSMRAAWARFAASGKPSTAALRWPSFNRTGSGLLLVAPQPHLDTDFASRHHCSFWAAA
jgi:para-nitrobenzyl esterase